MTNMTDLWATTTEQLKISLPQHAYNTWLEPIRPESINGNTIILNVPNQFFYEWIESHYATTIRKTVKSISNDTDVKFVVSHQKTEETENIQRPHIIKKETSNPNLNRHFSFSAFIEGNNNQFAKAAALAVSKAPGEKSFNPLIIYGGVGLGKTHLLHSIGNSILEINPNAGIVMASSEKFTQDFISSIQRNKTVAFAKQYRSADVLLIDDVQFFQGKEQTQEQFFHTFNELYQNGKQIVLTADRYPSEMVGLQDRLLSRFQSGLAVDIQPPDFEMRVAILLNKAEQNGLNLPYNMIEFLATHIKNNVRDLEGTIIRLLAHSSLMNKDIDFDLVKEVVKERIGKIPTSTVSVEDVVRRVSDTLNIKEKEIVGKSRKQEIVEARQMAMYLCRQVIGSSFASIGVYFGGRDHTTVLHAVKTIERKRNQDNRMGDLVKGLKQEFLLLPN
ncbi:MAG: chromosomal replication initiator protein DnaA [Candidatus Marinimicrobia bacterium]|jgi:chromosomal replication initiator protein|nr:chromosomal replication initiator protein DnaA [Candidatus Neomarinimicrobiota bacterium]